MVQKYNEEKVQRFNSPFEGGMGDVGQKTKNIKQKNKRIKQGLNELDKRRN
jgi:hypothetical protein